MDKFGKELKVKNSILDRDLNPGLLALRANALTNSVMQYKYGSMIELISMSHPF